MNVIISFRNGKVKILENITSVFNGHILIIVWYNDKELEYNTNDIESTRCYG